VYFTYEIIKDASGSIVKDEQMRFPFNVDTVVVVGHSFLALFWAWLAGQLHTPSQRRKKETIQRSVIWTGEDAITTPRILKRPTFPWIIE